MEKMPVKSDIVMFLHKLWTNEQILYNSIADFLCQCVCVVLFITVSESFASTSQIRKNNWYNRGAVKGGENELFLFNVKYSHSLKMKFRHIKNIGNITFSDL